MTEPLKTLATALSGRYEILEELGAGGMATVYLARDVRHDRNVALKVLRPDLATTLGPDRFLNEIRIAANLAHPHILPMHDSGEAGGFLYYVMPYIQGESLRDKLEREGELPIPEAVRILRDVADALAAAHAAGVVHRDIKPDNIMLSGRHALVVDFGVAKAVSDAGGNQQATTVGVALGTPHYMAPEQAVADPHVDHRADIYALGAMGYELLTGRPPFAGGTPQQVLTAHVTQAPDPVTRWRASVPPALEQLIARCLEKKAADRWQRAEELVPVLESLTTPSGGITPTGTRPIEAVGSVGMPALVRRVGWRRLGRTLGIYLIAALAVLQAVTFVMGQLGLPRWFLDAGVILLLMGLPIIFATALLNAAGVSTHATAPVAVPAPLRRTRRWFTWPRAILGGVLAFSALGAVGASVVWKRNQGHSLEPDIVAVLPFRVVGGDIDLWREGLVDLLSTALDGTGRLRASDPRAVMNAWHRTFGDDARLPEPDVAVEVARALQAGLMIQGSAVSTGPGEVRVTADIFNVKWLRKEGSVVADGPEGDMAGLVDRLSVDLLKSIWRAEEVPEIRVSSVTTSSVPALRAYLEGEQHFRRSEFVQARDAFTRAVEIDSTFAIAAHRLSIAYGWSAGAYAREHLRYAAMAARHLSGLPVRDSLLILGHKLVDFDGDLDVIPIYQRLTSSYPDDFEAWDGEGEAYWHLGAQAGYGPRDVVDALARGYAVDSTMAPSLIHLVQSANAVGDPDLVRTWTARYLALDSTSEQAEAFRLAAALRFGSPSDSSAAAAALDTASQRVLGGMGGSFAFSAVTGLGYFEAVYGAASDTRFPDRFRSNAHYGLADQYLRHGQLARWHEQSRRAAALRGSQGDLYTLAMARLAGVAQDSVSDGEFERLAGATRYPEDAPYLAFLYAKDGRTADARRGIEWFDHRADSLQAGADTAEAGAYRGLALAVRGQLAAAQDSVDAAIDQLRRGLSVMPAWANWRDYARYLLATLQESRGGESGALRTYESLFWTPSLEAVGYLAGAQLQERRGEREEALEDYERFLALWGDADPELQPRVRLAREAVERLKGATEQ